MVEVVVEFDYDAKEPDELSIKKGDIIKDVNQKTGGWWEGVLNDKKGMFPDNFVKIMEKDTHVVLRNKQDVVRIRKCRVVFSYNQDHEDELNLKAGDIIDIIGEEEEGWWRGTLNGKEGVFPSNFVEEILPTNLTISKSKPGSREDLTNISSETDTKAPVLPAKPSKQLCEVKYMYKAQNEDELSLKPGDIVTIINRDGQDPGWWKGELSGRVGVFPDNFVTILSGVEDKKAAGTAANSAEPSMKIFSVAQQRKSLETKSDKTNSENKTPPIPGKKPIIPIKKSPSSSGSGIFSEIKKKIVDVVDGATGSKSAKTETSNDLTKDNNNSENVFDQVERRPLLRDVRANRVKAPGRRPPTTLFKDDEDIGIVNGNAGNYIDVELINNDYQEPVIRHTDSLPPPQISSTETDAAEVKPKLREWEKHKAPWLEEMKQNQAKRTSTSPGPENKFKLTPTPTDKCEIDESKSTKVSPAVEKETGSSLDMSKSMSSLSSSLKTPQNELEKAPTIRSKPAIPPLSKLTLNNNIVKELPPAPKPTKVSPIPGKSPAITTPQPTMLEKSSAEIAGGGGDNLDTVLYKQYCDLLKRVQTLEMLMEKQHETHTAAIEELKGRLQVETDMRMMLQEELEKVSQCMMQV